MKKFLLFFFFFGLYSNTYALSPAPQGTCNAGPDQVIYKPETKLSATGCKIGAHWSVFGPGDGKVSFTDSHDPTTMVSFSEEGTYVLQWGVDGDYDNVVITYNTNCWAGYDKTVHVPEATLEATPCADNAEWEIIQIVGGGNAFFTNKYDPNTVVSFSKPGTYTLRWGVGGNSDMVTISYSTCDAGPDFGTFVPNVKLKKATACVDGAYWQLSKVFGNGQAIFKDKYDPNTEVFFTEAGQYILRWGIGFDYDDVTIDYIPCWGGPDQVICISQTKLAAECGAFGGWYVFSKPEGSIVTFQDESDPNTLVTFSQKGVYELVWGDDEHYPTKVKITYTSPQADICEHMLSCGAVQTEIGIDFTVYAGGGEGKYGIRIVNELDQQVHFSGDLSYGEKYTRFFPYNPNKQYRLILTDAGGEQLCLQNPYTLNFSEPQIDITVDQLSKTVCQGETISFEAEAFVPSQGCKGPKGEFSYKLYKKEGGQLLKLWVPTEDPIQTGLLPVGTYLLIASPTENKFSNCSDSVELNVLPSSLAAEIKTTLPACKGSADGTALALVTGGQKYEQGTAYHYAWFRKEDVNKEDTLSTLASVSALKSGDYLLEVRDAGACADPPIQVFFNLPDTPPMGTVTLSASGCGAKATMAPKGGEAPYTFIFEEKTQNGYKVLQTVKGSEQQNSIEAEASLPLPAFIRVKVIDGRGCSVISADTPLNAPKVTSEYEVCFRWRTAPKFIQPTPEPKIPFSTIQIKQTIEEHQKICLIHAEQALFAMEEGSCLRLSELSDATVLTYNQNEALHTLSYTDRAGNLLATVPPEGVNLLEGDFSRADHPSHTRKSTYAYDESGAALEAKNPNGGRTRFLYNRLGQLRFSQNESQYQQNTQQASFIKYDALARPIFNGVVKIQGSYTDPNTNKKYTTFLFDHLNDVLESDDVPFTELGAEDRYPGQGQSMSELNEIVYGKPQLVVYPITGSPQTHLRNRISMVRKQNGEESQDKHTRVYFSYDAHGNTSWRLAKRYDLPEQYARSEYDLITGKVNQTIANEARPDALWQHFSYDEEEKLLASESSLDGVLYDVDAEYEYYKHGPLKRTVLGGDKVQGIDLTNTLQGLVKAVNHPLNDPSQDGKSNKVGEDAFSSILHYYKGDFVHKNASFTSKDPYTLLEMNHARGGLIGGWVTKEGYGTSGTIHDQAWGRTFVYDQTGRLKISNTKLYNGQLFQNTDDYKETFTYDRNGNLTNLTRNAHSLNGKDRKQDQFTYVYQAGNDRLRHIKDAVPAGNWMGDIDDQPDNNYGYDASGRLQSDKSEGISFISWNDADKVTNITKSDNTVILFRYGPSDERIEKTVIPQNKEDQKISTLYANGMVYERKRKTVNANTYDEILTLKEQHLAEGMITKERIMETVRYEQGKEPYKILTFTFPKDFLAQSRGEKTYALKDHLGNVRVTVSDRKLSELQNNQPTNFKAEILSIARYDAFGSPQAERQFTAKNYRYGYNGMEKDDEVKGGGNSYDYGARFYDPRAGRWLSTDPLGSKFSGHSPYHFSFNNPIAFNDPTGMAPNEMCTELDLNGDKNISDKELKTHDLNNRRDYLKEGEQYLKDKEYAERQLHANEYGEVATAAEHERREKIASLNEGTANHPFNVALDLITAGAPVAAAKVRQIKNNRRIARTETIRSSSAPESRRNKKIASVIAEKARRIALKQIKEKGKEKEKQIQPQEKFGPGTPINTESTHSLEQGIAKRGIVVTEESVAKALQGSDMQTLQEKVSLPMVQRYVEMLENGSTAPPIKVSNGIIVEGNHRYVAGRILGVEPAQVPTKMAPSQAGRAIPINQIKVDLTDWGGH